MSGRSILRPSLALLASAALLAGCAAGPDYAPPGAVPALAPAYLTDYRPPVGGTDVWWEGFGDPELNAAVERALAGNLTLSAARDRLAAARAAVLAERSDRRPALDLQGGLEASGDTGGGSVLGGTGSGGVLFNPDLNGRLSREIAAAAARARASDYVVADTRRLVAATVAQQVIEIRRSEARLALLEESTDLQERTLRIVELRFEAGLSANLDVRRAAADLAQTEAQRGVLLLQRAQAVRALSVLLGETPQPLPEVADKPVIPRFAGGAPTGIPADLLRRRPDILVAEANLAEAAALVGAEQADLLPALALSGTLSAGDRLAAGLIGDVFGAIGVILDVPILDGGRRRAEIAAARAEADARFREYQQTVLEALRDVENALVAIASYSDRSARLRDAIRQSEAAFVQSNALYREGLTSLFDVLDAQRQLIGSRQSLIDSDAAIAASVIDLYAAIGAPTDRI
ncbi:TolC family protein [Sphingomonas sp. ac-8]|uniref:TolC family protein n=1 Tax=Sphingomonas sp. ac-8 TaxID=3242977 RepID=UPI003A80F955